MFHNYIISDYSSFQQIHLDCINTPNEGSEKAVPCNCSIKATFNVHCRNTRHKKSMKDHQGLK